MLYLKKPKQMWRFYFGEPLASQTSYCFRMHPNRLSYLFYHISFTYPNIKQLLPFMQFEGMASLTTSHPTIKFPFAINDTPTENIKWINEIPILFPLSENQIIYRFDTADNLIFEHDVLKSAFYLISAQQETETTITDEFKRFSFEQSIQKKLGIALNAIVNAYFKIIGDALTEFSKRHNIAFTATRPFETFAFHLSHDIDRLYFHHPKEVAGRLLQLLGWRKREHSVKALVNTLLLDAVSVWRYKTKDRWWNFEFLTREAARLGFRSSFYFLPHTGHRLNARYQLNDKRLSALYKQLTDNGFEVGLHIPLFHKTLNSKSISPLTNTSNSYKIGVRRHYLSFNYPNDYTSDSLTPVLYDASFGFHDQAGFRNSYCLPFKPYNHINECMVDTWVLPLTAMDVTFLYKQQNSFERIEQQLDAMANEAAKYGGIVSLLWHNCRFDEEAFPGITSFYCCLLEQMQQKGAIGLTGRDIVARMDEPSNADYSTFINFFNKGLTCNE
jgi:hypothetical protein